MGSRIKLASSSAPQHLIPAKYTVEKITGNGLMMSTTDDDDVSRNEK